MAQPRDGRLMPATSSPMILGYCYGGLLALLWSSGLVYQHYRYG